MKIYDANGLVKNGPGPAGAPGATGAQGPIGPAAFLSAEDGEDGWGAIPGRDGTNGVSGATGAQGPVGPAVFLTAEDGAEGDTGAPGLTGPGGTANVTPDTHPTPATSFDDEFEQASLSSQWTWSNQNSATAVPGQGMLRIVADRTGGSDYNILMEPCPPGTWTLVAKVRGLRGTATSTNSTMGLVVKGSAGYSVYGAYWNGNWQIIVQDLVSPTNHSADHTGLGTFPSPAQNPLNESEWLYLKISYDGTNLTFSWSLTGNANAFVQAYTATAASWVGTPSNFGYFVNSATTLGVEVLSDWFRRTA